MSPSAVRATGQRERSGICAELDALLPSILERAFMEEL